MYLLKEWWHHAFGADPSDSRYSLRTIYGCLVAVALLFACIDPLQRWVWSIPDLNGSLHWFNCHWLAPVFAGLLFLYSMFGWDRDARYRLFGVIESVAIYAAIRVFSGFVLSTDGGFPYSVFCFLKNASMNMEPNFFRRALFIASYPVYYLLVLSPGILLAVLFRFFTKHPKHYSMDDMNYLFLAGFRLVCFLMLLIGFVLYAQEYRFSFASSGFKALVLAVLLQLLTDCIHFCSTEDGD